MDDITRLHTGKRLSEASIHGRTVYLAGQVAADAAQDIRGQTTQVLAAVDRLLLEAGTEKSRILRVQVFLARMEDYDGMNAVWEAWVPAGRAPARATVEARLAKPQWRVEMVVTAALPPSPAFDRA